MSNVFRARLTWPSRFTKAFSTDIIQKARRDHWKNDKTYQYLEQSLVPTDKFQTSLPRLPIPDLALTTQRYLDSQRAILTDEKFANTKLLVDDFLSNTGKDLQKDLEALNDANPHTSYIRQPWTDTYLKDRRQVTFNHNAGMLFINDSREEMMKMEPRAASILISSLRFHKSLRENILKPDVIHANSSKTNNDLFWSKVQLMKNDIATSLSSSYKVFPLDMSQHKHLFQSTRIPDVNRDRIVRFPNAKHILIMRKGHFYTFPAYDEDWNLFEPKYYLDAIKNIVSDEAPESSGIGALTSLNRDEWLEMRGHLESSGNAHNLELIDSALFNICLDDEFIHIPGEENRTVMNSLAGLNPTNRWFDKSFSLICTKNGILGLNLEHSWGDGISLMRYVDEVTKDSQENDFVLSSCSSNAYHEAILCRLRINTDDKIKAAVKKAEESFQQKTNSVALSNFKLTGMGKKLCKQHNVSPDGLMQAAFQVAYYKMFGKFAATYESCTTATFKHGRTETVRSATIQTSNFSKVMKEYQDDLRIAEFHTLLRACSKKHNELTRNGFQGQGWDRHLFALKHLASQKMNSLPSIFQDGNYHDICSIILSTSTLPSSSISTASFCPVTPRGFGIGYLIREDQLGFSVSSYRDQSDGEKFRDILGEVFQSFHKKLQIN